MTMTMAAMTRDAQAYREGKRAHERGASVDCGPYSNIDWEYRTEQESTILRSWMEGWFDAREELEEYLAQFTEYAPDTYDETFGL